MPLADLIPILQMAVGPVILISGVGLLLLSMTNRYGRVIDRARSLAEAIRRGGDAERTRLAGQLDILARRARLVRLAITLASASVLFAALMIIALFVAAMLRLELGGFVALLFIACMGSLIGSLAVFIADINVSLSALKLEIPPNPDRR